MNNIGYKVKVLRQRLNLTQEEVKSDVLSRSTLSKIETGKLIPSLEQVEYLAEKYNVPVSELLDDSNYNKSDKNYNNKRLIKMYDDKKYFEIIDKIKPNDFLTYYYVGMSYYKIDLKEDAEKYLGKCEHLFKNLQEDNKINNVDKLCIALNSLRRSQVDNYNSSANKKHLDKMLYYLKLYKAYNYEIYYIVNNNIANYFISNSMYQEAIDLIEKTIRLNKTMIAVTVLPHFHNNLGFSYFSISNYKKSAENFRKAAFFFDYLDDYYQAQVMEVNIFNCYLYMGEFSKCMEVIEKTFSNDVDFRLEDRFQNLKLILLYNEGNMEGIMKESRKINLNKLAKKSRTDFYYVMGRTDLILGKKKQAITYDKKCINYLKESMRYKDLALLYNDLYLLTGDKEYLDDYNGYRSLYKKQKFISIQPDITSPKSKFGISPTNKFQVGLLIQ